MGQFTETFKSMNLDWKSKIFIDIVIETKQKCLVLVVLVFKKSNIMMHFYNEQIIKISIVWQLETIVIQKDCGIHKLWMKMKTMIRGIQWLDTAL